MFAAELTLFGQAAPDAEIVTPLQQLAGTIAMITMSGSLALMVRWIVRWKETGHAIPAAQRGLLRIPPILTWIVSGLSLLMALMVMLDSLVDDQDSRIPVAPATAMRPQEHLAEPEPDTELLLPTESPTEGHVAEEPAVESAAETTELTPEAMRNSLVSIIAFDVVVFLVIGTIVFLASADGRFFPRTPSAASGVASETARESLTSEAPAVEAPDVLPREYDATSLHQELPANPASEHPAQDADAEPFSLLAEFRFAIEVFLVAYLPTTLLRIIVVLLTIRLTGEDPGSHPLLEMMQSGADPVLLSLIVLTAVVLAPVVEELQFRVVMLGGLLQLSHQGLALVISSIGFSMAHGFPDAIALLPLAFALGYTYLQRRSYCTVMMVHFLFNGFNLLLALLAMQ